jgi:site-specific DNA-methyltransferase (cytosine-N4-specific)
MRFTVINKPVLEALKQIPDETIDCIVTSPPYYSLRSYKEAETVWGGDPNCAHEWRDVRTERVDVTGFERNRRGLNKAAELVDGRPRFAKTENPPVDKSASFCAKCGAWKGQLGLEPDYKRYLDHLLLVTAELKRTLKPTGVLFWNQGDTYSGSGGAGGDYNAGGIREGQPKYRQAGVSDIPVKSLMQLPNRFAIRMVDEQGWILRNAMLWKKLNPMPASVKDRLSNSYEYVFFFVKQRKYFFNLDAVRVPNKVVGVTDMRPPVLRQRLYKNSSYNKSDDPHLAQFKAKPDLVNDRNGDSLHVRPLHSLGKNSGGALGTTDNPVEFFRAKGQGGNYDYNGLHSDGASHYHVLGKNPGDVLELTNQPFRGMHFATFPPKLPGFCIKAGCPVGGLVLDPFAGSGTTLLVAKQLGRSAIGIEISSEYVKIIKERLNWGMGLDVEWVER